MDRADWSTATVRNASRMASRMASRRANVNDIFASCLPVHDIGEGQGPCKRVNRGRTCCGRPGRPHSATSAARRAPQLLLSRGVMGREDRFRRFG